MASTNENRPMISLAATSNKSHLNLLRNMANIGAYKVQLAQAHNPLSPFFKIHYNVCHPPLYRVSCLLVKRHIDLVSMLWCGQYSPEMTQPPNSVFTRSTSMTRSNCKSLKTSEKEQWVPTLYTLNLRQSWKMYRRKYHQECLEHKKNYLGNQAYLLDDQIFMWMKFHMSSLSRTFDLNRLHCHRRCRIDTRGCIPLWSGQEVLSVYQKAQQPLTWSGSVSLFFTLLFNIPIKLHRAVIMTL